MYDLAHVIHPSTLVAPVFPSLQPLNVYPVFATAVTAVHVPRYCMLWFLFHDTAHHTDHVYVTLYVLIVNCPVIILFAFIHV